MKKGISPVVAVVLLIAIAVIAAVGLYFWVGGLATKQPTPNEPSVISATCSSGTILISNIGNTALNTAGLTGTTSGTAPDAPGTCNVTAGMTLSSGATCVYAIGASGSGVIYSPNGGQASYNC